MKNGYEDKKGFFIAIGILHKGHIIERETTLMNVGPLQVRGSTF